MSGGVKDIDVRQCLFEHTDRGLRIKTRRGRGKDAVIDNVKFENIRMKNVLVPLVINMFYFCDPDGKTEYVWSKEKLPVDERTPRLGRFHFRDIVCTDSEWAAGFFYGLPEQPIEEIVLENVAFRMKSGAGSGTPAMMTDAKALSKAGLHFTNVKTVRLLNVTLTGADGDGVVPENVGEIVGTVSLKQT
jgi:polygalacturonase